MTISNKKKVVYSEMDKIIGSLLRSARKSKGYSMRQASNILNKILKERQEKETCSSQQIAHYEHGFCRVTASRLVLFSEIYCVSVSMLLPPVTIKEEDDPMSIHKQEGMILLSKYYSFIIDEDLKKSLMMDMKYYYKIQMERNKYLETLNDNEF